VRTGYIDLSKRRVSPEDLQRCDEKFNKAKAVNSLLRHVAETTGMDLEELYKRTAWALDKKGNGPGSSYEMFKLAIK
jgi:translation initiation factor 2 subunit 1